MVLKIFHCWYVFIFVLLLDTCDRILKGIKILMLSFMLNYPEDFRKLSARVIYLELIDLPAKI